jgi:hypothetical protein
MKLCSLALQSPDNLVIPLGCAVFILQLHFVCTCFDGLSIFTAACSIILQWMQHSLVLHELIHGNVVVPVYASTFWGIVMSLPGGLPIFTNLRSTHIQHHLYQGVQYFDPYLTCNAISNYTPLPYELLLQAVFNLCITYCYGWKQLLYVCLINLLAISTSDSYHNSKNYSMKLWIYDRAWIKYHYLTPTIPILKLRLLPYTELNLPPPYTEVNLPPSAEAINKNG